MQPLHKNPEFVAPPILIPGAGNVAKARRDVSRKTCPVSRQARSHIMFKFGSRGSAAQSSERKRNRRTGVLAAACKPTMELLEERRLYSFSGSAVLPTGMSVTAIASADFNGDGFADIVTVGSVSGRGLAVVQLNHGDGTYSAPISAPTNNTPIEVQTGDFDGDGHCDIVTL